MNEATPDLRIRENTFEFLRRSGTYIDKTALIYSLAAARQPVVLLRPPRFGKTLLVDAFASLFGHGLKHFAGLEIESLWDDRIYPVIRLNLASLPAAETPEDFASSLELLLRQATDSCGLKMPPVDGVGHITAIDCLDTMLSQLEKEGLEAVLLIDECDAPLIACRETPAVFTTVQRTLTRLYDRLKKHSGALRFMFVTGTFASGACGIFRGSNVDDISLDRKYGSLLGFTPDEIRSYFAPVLERAAAVNGLSLEQCLEEMSRRYGGYRFDLRATTSVLDPHSVLGFLHLNAPGFPSFKKLPPIISSLLQQKCPTAEAGTAIWDHDVFIDACDLSAFGNMQNAADEILLAQAGCLSIVETYGDSLTLRCPNVETAAALSAVCSPS